MQNIHIVKDFQALDYVNENVPNVTFLDFSFLKLVLGNLLEEVSPIGVIHNDTELEPYHKVQLVSVRNTSLYPMMFGALMEASIRTSFKAFLRSLSLSSGSFTFFNAYLHH